MALSRFFDTQMLKQPQSLQFEKVRLALISCGTLTKSGYYMFHPRFALGNYEIVSTHRAVLFTDLHQLPGM